MITEHVIDTSSVRSHVIYAKCSFFPCWPLQLRMQCGQCWGAGVEWKSKTRSVFLRSCKKSLLLSLSKSKRVVWDREMVVLCECVAQWKGRLATSSLSHVAPHVQPWDGISTHIDLRIYCKTCFIQFKTACHLLKTVCHTINFWNRFLDFTWRLTCTSR